MVIKQISKYCCGTKYIQHTIMSHVAAVFVPVAFFLVWKVLTSSSASGTSVLDIIIQDVLSSWQSYLLCIVGCVVAIVCFGVYRMFVPKYVKSKNYHDHTTARYKAMRKKHFYPGFSNGWHAVCNTEDLKDNKIKNISALGTDMVAFRGEDGKVGVLHAFCPHLGAHLGEGGTIDGNLIVCPFHNWSFDAEGKCQKIPYMKSDCALSDRTKTKAYQVRELLGMVLVWFHAEEKFADNPEYEPLVSVDLAEGINDGSCYFSVMRTMEFDQHSCEMAMNSADQHHFDTLHAPFPIPFLNKIITGVHKIKAEYGKGIVGGKVVEEKHLTVFKEKTEGLYFFGNKKYPVPYSEKGSEEVDTTVIFEGPTLVHFIIDTPFGRIRQLMTILSVEPFKQYVESRWYAENSVPKWFTQFIAYVGAGALEQDRQVWENKVCYVFGLLLVYLSCHNVSILW